MFYGIILEFGVLLYLKFNIWYSKKTLVFEDHKPLNI